MNIIKKEADYFIVHKPAGVSFEGESGILSLLRAEFPEALGVHRLDKETTGLMLFARNKDAQRKLSLLFANKLIEKTYIALSFKKPIKKMGTIKGDLEKGRGGSYYLRRTTSNPSLTKFSSFYDPTTKLRLFILKPLTGQTHQLRVHLKSIGSEILGDARYGNTHSDRMYLACVGLKFDWCGQRNDYFFYPIKGDHFLDKSIKSLFLENLGKKKEC